MTRHFYKDALAAAWMEDKYNMRFTDKDGREITIVFCTGEFGTAGPFYIHPDSLHLLEPHVGDLISHFGLRAWRVDGIKGNILEHPAIGNEKTDRFTLRTDSPIIIQRNGIAFMWPESEAP